MVQAKRFSPAAAGTAGQAGAGDCFHMVTCGPRGMSPCHNSPLALLLACQQLSGTGQRPKNRLLGLLCSTLTRIFYAVVAICVAAFEVTA